jgi:hypothetical protein
VVEHLHSKFKAEFKPHYQKQKSFWKGMYVGRARREEGGIKDVGE